MRIAVVEDNASVAAAVVAALSTCGHEADWLSRGADVLERHAAFDAILLDLGLPDRDGLEVLSDIRAVSTVPVVVLTARGDENSVVLTADVVRPRRRTSVIHGAPGIGSVVLGGAPGLAATLLIGEDLATGDPVADVGWTTGELVELAGRAGGGPRWRGFVDALHHRMSVVSAPARRLSTTTVYGLTVVVESVRSEGRAALAVHHRAGFRREAVGEEGVAHLLEHVMFRGGAAVPRGTFHDHVLGFAGHAGGTTHQDFTEYTQRVPVGCLDDAVFAEVDRLFAAEIGDEAVAEQLPGVIAGVRHHSGHAFGGFPWPAMGPVLFADHAHAHDGWGDPADLARMDASTCRRFHERCYRPADAVLTVVGDVDLETVVGAIDRACRGHRPAPARTPRDTPRPRWRDGASVRVRVPGEGPSAFAVGYALPDPIDHLDEYLAATVLSDVLTGTRPADGTPWSAASGVFGPLEVARGDVLTVTTSPWWGTGTAARVGRSIAGLHGRTVDVPAATPASTLEWSVVDVDGVDGVAAGPTADPAAYAALTAIGGFHGARLHAATTVDAYAGRDTLLGAPRTFVVASGAPGSSLDAMQSDIARWHRDVSERPPDDDEIHRARCFAAGQLSSMIESPAHLADTTSRSLATGTPPETVLALPSAVAAVDPSRVRAAVPDLVAGRCAFTVRSRSRHDYTGARDHPDHHDTGGTP